MTTFLNLLNESDKQKALLSAIESGKGKVVSFNPENFRKIPGSPFAYWVSDRVLKAYEGSKFDDELNGRGTRCGLGTLDDFRFIRLFWEPKDRAEGWVTYFHGGIFSRFYDNFPLVVNWADSGKQIKVFVEKKVGSASRKVQGEDKYFQPGFVFPRRTKGFSPKFMPRGGIFSTGGQAGFAPPEELAQTIGLLASQVSTFLISLSQGRTGDAAQYEVGLVKRLPWPVHEEFEEKLASLAYRGWSLRRTLNTTEEISPAFLLPELLRERLDGFDVKGITAELDDIQYELNKIALQIYGLEEDDCVLINHEDSEVDELLAEAAESKLQTSQISNFCQTDNQKLESLLSWVVGVIFGRFDWRIATSEREIPPEPHPLDALPEKSPGMLPDGAESFFRHSGVLTDDEGHPADIPRLVEEVLALVNVPVQYDVRRWLQRDFFAYHLQHYSISRRKAPIYWPLSTASGRYTIWLYYPDLSSQTIFTVVNDFVEPKLYSVRDEMNGLRKKGDSLSKQEEKELEELEQFEQELADLRDLVLDIASSYRPNQDDGVQITAAPLWPLFRHKPWQKVLKDTWKQLGKGDYDWANLALNYWPDRVLRKCHEDRSLAIAHDVEALFWEEVEVPVIRRGKDTGETKLEWQPKDLSASELDALIKRTFEERGLQSEFR